MNYWPRYVGDIQRKTGHLSCAEMGAYDRLLDHVYATEEPLLGDVDACCRIARAMDKSERQAVASVLRQFFTLTEDGYRNGRADEEIEKDKPRREAAKANGKRGGRPKTTNREPNGNPAGYPAGTQDEPRAKAPQPQPQHTPSDEGVARKRAPAPKPPCPDDVDAQVWDDWLRLRKAKSAPVTLTVIDGARSEAGKAGMSLEAFLRVWCRRGSQGLEAAWLKPDERQQPTGETAFQRHQRERVEEMTGGLLSTRPKQTAEVIDVTAKLA